MYIDPAEIILDQWNATDPSEMWDKFTDALILDEESVKHLLSKQAHIVRMMFYCVMMSVTPVPLRNSAKYLIAVNDKDFLLRNIMRIQVYNKHLTYEIRDDLIYIFPLPIIFKIDCFADSKTYQIPNILGGNRFAYDLFATTEST